MAIKYIIVLFVETPRKFITAVINLRGVSTNKTIIIKLLLVISIVFVSLGHPVQCHSVSPKSILYRNYPIFIRVLFFGHTVYKTSLITLSL
jgi:uncharacterized membrane protein SpoIIM required for sporulation